MAQELVAKKAPLLGEEILQLAFYLPDQGQHKAAGERGSAFFAGAYRHGGITRLRSSCRSWPWSIQAVTRYIQQKSCSCPSPSSTIKRRNPIVIPAMTLLRT